MTYKELLREEIRLKNELLVLEEGKAETYKSKIPLSKGWYTQVYQKEMDLLLLELTQKENAVFIYIRQKFDKGPRSQDRDRNLVNVTIEEIVEATAISIVVVKTAVAKLLAFNMFQRVGKSGFMINPFVYVPMYSHGGKLQKEWKEMFGNDEGITL